MGIWQDSLFLGIRVKYMVFTIAVLVIISLCLWVAGPVLLTFQTGPMGGDTQVRIFNPLRNRAPERAAEIFLESLKMGRCQEILSAVIDNTQSRQAICRIEADYPLMSWRLRDREDGIEQSTLSFWYKRKDYDGEERLFIWVSRHNEQWRVTDYKRNY